ncbi:DUF2867 domain-containing protein [Nocardioides immobilis]|uniref:DUF2867 domain-containing protein n=1 Tax=Nocardioides immobilis TaxID=2049295 RepID=A0A417XYP6_9ACTN|nr:DUF2867 domain-containing protein [Nocardioides immobilis]RHW25500.1 DUF2867 domain-containing protein [Nocardioides immobilis]
MTETALRTRPLPPEAHTGRPWRIHEIAPDFRLEDVWALPTPGGPDDLSRLVEQLAAGGDERDFPLPYRILLAIRWRLGDLFGLDDESTGVGDRVASLRDRLPDDLRGTTGPGFEKVPFEPVYLTEDEYVAEVANSTVHALLHLGWVEDASVRGGHRAQMAVLVKPNGWFGEAYMAFIKPFRHLVVYPALLRTIGRQWARQVSA